MNLQRFTAECDDDDEYPHRDGWKVVEWTWSSADGKFRSGRRASWANSETHAESLALEFNRQYRIAQGIAVDTFVPA